MDFPRTWEMLRARGMISGTKPWPALTDDQRQADLERINELHGAKFYPVDENLAMQASKKAPANPA